MTDTAASSSEGNPAGKQDPKRGFFGRIILFVRQIIAELRKVVVPTRKELIRFTITVLVFVIIMMALVYGMDVLFVWIASYVFGVPGA